MVEGIDVVLNVGFPGLGCVALQYLLGDILPNEARIKTKTFLAPSWSLWNPALPNKVDRCRFMIPVCSAQVEFWDNPRKGARINEVPRQEDIVNAVLIRTCGIRPS